MKKLLSFLILACFVTTTYAQFFSRLIPKKKEKKEKVETTEKRYSVFPPLGIPWPNNIPLAAVRGSEVGDRGIQGDARTKGRWSIGDFRPDNEEATRFLEKAVQENDVQKVEKLLKAGASAFVNYEMIDKKQYEIIDAMYRDNPKLILYSQMLHYACAKSDTNMIDFLIDRGASLDLYGYFIKKDGWGDYTVMCRWNGDIDYKNTPADVALYHDKWANLRHLANKYHKYPTINGCALDFYFFIHESALHEKNVQYAQAYLAGEKQFSFLKHVDYTIADVMNFGYHQLVKRGDKMLPQSYFPINAIISKIAACRKQDANGGKEFVDILNLMLEHGASVGAEADNGARHRYIQSTIGMGYLENYTNTTPMTIALTNKNMMDIIQLLRSKGASMTTEMNGRRVSVLQVPGVLDEYKEFFMLEGQ